MGQNWLEVFQVNDEWNEKLNPLNADEQFGSHGSIRILGQITLENQAEENTDLSLL